MKEFLQKFSERNLKTRLCLSTVTNSEGKKGKVEKSKFNLRRFEERKERFPQLQG